MEGMMEKITFALLVFFGCVIHECPYLCWFLRALGMFMVFEGAIFFILKSLNV